MNEQARAVLWDMDGTLLDSAEHHWLSWREALADEGLAMTYEQFLATFGLTDEGVLRTVFGPGFPSDRIERIADEKEARYREIVRREGVEPLPGVRRWLARLKAEGWRQAVASSGPRLNVETILDVLGIADYFDALVSSEDVERGKPDPQVFLVAAARLGVAPARCVVIEDAPAGIEAARRAGMHSIGVGGRVTSAPADLIVPTLEDLPDDAFDRLV